MLTSTPNLSALINKGLSLRCHLCQPLSPGTFTTHGPGVLSWILSLQPRNRGHGPQPQEGGLRGLGAGSDTGAPLLPIQADCYYASLSLLFAACHPAHQNT